MPAPRNALSRFVDQSGGLDYDPSWGEVVRQLPGAFERKARGAAQALPNALLDMLTAGPFGRLNEQLASADATGTPRADAMDYGDLMGAFVGPMTAGAAGVPRNALGAMGSKAFDLDYFGQPVRILQNPAEAKLKAWLGRTKFKAARRVVDPDTGDVFVWDAGDPALHAQVAKELGVDPSKMQADVIGLDD